MERKHGTDDVCDLGVTRNLVSGDAAGSRLPRSTATKYSLCPQSITVGFLSQESETAERIWYFCSP